MLKPMILVKTNTSLCCIDNESSKRPSEISFSYLPCLPVWDKNVHLSIVVIDNFFSRALLTQGIYGLMADDCKQPGSERPLWIIGMAGLMNSNQGFLHTIFNKMVVTKTTPKEFLYYIYQFFQQLPIIGLVTRLRAHHER